MPIVMDKDHHTHVGGGDGGANLPGSAHSSEFSLISDFELMGGSGMERDVDARVALLISADLTAIVGQIQIGDFCRESSSLVVVVPHSIL